MIYPQAPPSWPLAVYVHMPFCAYRCRYCNFVFETGWSEGVLAKTLAKIVSDAESARQGLESSGWNGRVKTLYFGGGTPSVVPPLQLEAFLSKFFDLWRAKDPLFAPDEITFEANPENLSPQLLEVLTGQKVDRVSLGVQTFDDDALALLGRRCDADTNRRALARLAEFWEGRWSADLMTGLPGQNPAKLSCDIEELLAFSPFHVSLYALTVETGTPLADLARRKEIVLPERDLADELWLQARDALVKAGLAWYEVANFARSGHESVHNQVYWRLDPYLGLGPGAASTLPALGGWERRIEPGLFAWLTGSKAESESLSVGDFLKEHFLTALRTSPGLDLNLLQDRLGREPRNWAQSVRTEWIDRGWADPRVSENTLRLYPSGRQTLDSLLAELDWPL